MEPHDNMFDVEGLRRLQREARTLTAGLSEFAGTDSRADGWDRSHKVRVTVDGSGRVIDAEIGPSWRDVIKPDELGNAVIGAVNAAETERMNAWKQAFQQPAAPTIDTPDDLEPEHLTDPGIGGPAASRSPSDPDVVSSTRDLYYLAMDVTARLSEARRAMDDEAAKVVRVHSPNRHVTVTSESGRVVSVDFDHAWVSRATATVITGQLRAVFAALDRTGTHSPASDVLDNSSVRELQQAASDPLELLRRLGLG